MDVYFCYTLIKDYNMDKGYKKNHLELLAKLNESLDKTIRALENKFKYLPRYMKTEPSQEAETDTDTPDRVKSPERFETKFYQARRGHFITEALVYFTAGGFLLKSNIYAAILVFLIALVLVILSFIPRPTKLAEWIYSATAMQRAIPLIIFTITLFAIVAILYSSEGTAIFAFSYTVVGLVFLFLIFAHEVFEWIISRDNR